MVSNLCEAGSCLIIGRMVSMSISSCVAGLRLVGVFVGDCADATAAHPATTIPTAIALAGALVAVVALLALMPSLSRRAA